MKKILVLCFVFVSLASVSYAQVRGPANNGAVDVNCVAGCAAGAVATENGTFAGGQSVGAFVNLSYLWNGANWVRMIGDATNGLKVQCTTGCGSPPATADNTAFTAGTTNVTPVAFVFNSGIAALTSGSYGAARVSSNRVQLHINWDAAGNERGANVNASNQLSVSVDNSPTVDTELPAAAALADTVANPTITSTGSYGMVFDGTNWYRQRGNANGSIVIGPISPGSAIGTTNGLLNGGLASATAPADTSGDNQAVRAWHLRSGAYVIQPSYSGTLADSNSGNKSAGTVRVVIATDQPQLTNKLLVTPDSVALPANQSVNLSQVAGTTTDTNSGNKSAGTIRVVLATDQPALTNKLLVTPDSVALPANQSVNVTQFGGTNITTGTGAAGAGIPRVTISNDSSLAANQSVNQAQVGGTAVVAQPCQEAIPTTVAVSQTANAKLISQTSAKKNYICSGVIVGADAENLSIVEGTGSTCGTGTAAVIGGTTAANGPNLAANGGFIIPSQVGGTGTNLDLCLYQSGSGRVAGYITYVQF